MCMRECHALCLFVVATPDRHHRTLSCSYCNCPRERRRYPQIACPTASITTGRIRFARMHFRALTHMNRWTRHLMAATLPHSMCRVCTSCGITPLARPLSRRTWRSVMRLVWSILRRWHSCTMPHAMASLRLSEHLCRARMLTPSRSFMCETLPDVSQFEHFSTTPADRFLTTPTPPGVCTQCRCVCVCGDLCAEVVGLTYLGPRCGLD